MSNITNERISISSIGWKELRRFEFWSCRSRWRWRLTALWPAGSMSTRSAALRSHLASLTIQARPEESSCSAMEWGTTIPEWHDSDPELLTDSSSNDFWIRDDFDPATFPSAFHIFFENERNRLLLAILVVYICYLEILRNWTTIRNSCNQNYIFSSSFAPW